MRLTIVSCSKTITIIWGKSYNCHSQGWSKLLILSDKYLNLSNLCAIELISPMQLQTLYNFGLFLALFEQERRKDNASFSNKFTCLKFYFCLVWKGKVHSNPNPRQQQHCLQSRPLSTVGLENYKIGDWLCFKFTLAECHYVWSDNVITCDQNLFRDVTLWKLHTCPKWNQKCLLCDLNFGKKETYV